MHLPGRLAIGINGHVRVMLNGKVIYDDTNAITTQFLQYLQNMLQGTVPTVNSIYVLAKPIGTPIALNSLNIQNGYQQVNMTFANQNVPQPVQALELWISTNVGNYPVAVLQLQNAITQSGQMLVQWTINIQLPSIIQGAQVFAISDSIPQIIMQLFIPQQYFSTPIQLTSTQPTLQIYSTPQVTPTVIVPSNAGAGAVAYISTSSTISTFSALLYLLGQYILTVAQGNLNEQAVNSLIIASAFITFTSSNITSVVP